MPCLKSRPNIYDVVIHQSTINPCCQPILLANSTKQTCFKTNNGPCDWESIVWTVIRFQLIPSAGFDQTWHPISAPTQQICSQSFYANTSLCITLNYMLIVLTSGSADCRLTMSLSASCRAPRTLRSLAWKIWNYVCRTRPALKAIRIFPFSSIYPPRKLYY